MTEERVGEILADISSRVGGALESEAHYYDFSEADPLHRGREVWRTWAMLRWGSESDDTDPHNPLPVVICEVLNQDGAAVVTLRYSAMGTGDYAWHLLHDDEVPDDFVRLARLTRGTNIALVEDYEEGLQLVSELAEAFTVFTDAVKVMN